MEKRRVAVGDVFPYPPGPVLRTEEWGVDPEVRAAVDPTGWKLWRLTGLLAQLSSSGGTEEVREEAARLLRDLRDDPLLSARFADRNFRDRFQVRWLRMVEESTPDTRAAWFRPEPDPEAPDFDLVEVGIEPRWPEPFASDATWVAWSERWLQRRARHALLRRDIWLVRLVIVVSQLLRRDVDGHLGLAGALRTGLMPSPVLDLHLLARTRWEQAHEENRQRNRKHEELMRSRARPALHPELMAREQERMLREGPELVGRASELGVTQDEWDEARRTGRTLSIFGLALADDSQPRREEERDQEFQDAVEALQVEALQKGPLVDDNSEPQIQGWTVRLRLKWQPLLHRLRSVRETLPLALGPGSLPPEHLIVADGHLIARGNITGAVLAVLDRGLLVRRFDPGSTPPDLNATPDPTAFTDIGGELAVLGLNERHAVLIPWSTHPQLERATTERPFDLDAVAEQLAADMELVLEKWALPETEEERRDAADGFLSIVDVLGRGQFSRACGFIVVAPLAVLMMLELVPLGRYSPNLELLVTSGVGDLSFESGDRFGARNPRHDFWSSVYPALRAGLGSRHHLPVRIRSEEELPMRGGMRYVVFEEDGHLIISEDGEGMWNPEVRLREHADFVAKLHRWTDLSGNWGGDLRALGLSSWFAGEELYLAQRYSLDSLIDTLDLGAVDPAGAPGLRRMVSLCVPTAHEWNTFAKQVDRQARSFIWSAARRAAVVATCEDTARRALKVDQEQWDAARTDGRVLNVVSIDASLHLQVTTLVATDWALAIIHNLRSHDEPEEPGAAHGSMTESELFPWPRIERIETDDADTSCRTIDLELDVPATVPVTRGSEGTLARARGSESGRFAVRLLDGTQKKIQVIKEVRALTNLGLKEAKDLIDGTPSMVLEGVTLDEAEDAHRVLSEVGARVEVLDSTGHRTTPSFASSLTRTSPVPVDPGPHRLTLWPEGSSVIDEELVVPAVERFLAAARRLQQWRRALRAARGARKLAHEQAREQARAESGTPVRDWSRALAAGAVITECVSAFYSRSLTFATVAATDAGLVVHRTVWDSTAGPDPRAGGYTTDISELIPWRAIRSIEQSTPDHDPQRTDLVIRRLTDERARDGITVPGAAQDADRFLVAARTLVPDAVSRARDLEEAVRRAQSQARIDSGSDKRDWDEAVASGRVVTVTHAMGRTVDIDGQRVAARLRITTAAAADAGLVTHSTVWDATKGPDPRDGSYTQGEAELIPWRSISSIRRTAITVTIESVTGRTIRIDIANAPRIDADDLSITDPDGELMTDTEAIARTVPLFVEAAQRKIAATH